jgi:hypothetical protein
MENPANDSHVAAEGERTSAMGAWGYGDNVVNPSAAASAASGAAEKISKPSGDFQSKVGGDVFHGGYGRPVAPSPERTASTGISLGGVNNPDRPHLQAVIDSAMTAKDNIEDAQNTLDAVNRNPRSDGRGRPPRPNVPDNAPTAADVAEDDQHPFDVTNRNPRADGRGRPPRPNTARYSQ